MDAEYFCVQCRQPFRNRFPLDEHGRCTACRLGLRDFDAAYSYGVYEGPLRTLIHLLKYEKVRPLAVPLGGLLASALPLETHFDCVVPMPLHWRRRWSRGFNQCELLARELSRRRGIPMLEAVRRRKFTTPQAGLSGAKRRTNVSGAFRGERRKVKGKRVLLIDDVYTTGATVAACSRALRKAGASYVAVLTLARVDRRVLFAGLEVDTDKSAADVVYS